MLKRKSYLFLLAGGVLFLVFSVLWLGTAQPASAQCGSQASSCKSCHEVQGQMPVNNDGTGWHKSHAFGDFCYICHAGNNQAVEKDAAHAGMESPMANVQASCQQCHPNDLDERAQVYAVVLGVEVGQGGGTTPAAPAATEAPAAAPQAEPLAGMVVNQPTIDYVQQYNETVLGQARPVNVGNVILILLAVGLLAGGGAFVYFNERKLRGTLEQAKVREEPQAVCLEDYPQEVVALLPQVAALNPIGRRALQRLLANPEAASNLLHSLSKIDPDLIRKFKSLDREAQALLLALSGD